MTAVHGSQSTVHRKKKQGRIFVISAPSGCGKTTLLKKLISDKDLKLAHSVSMTSRPPRPDELEGRDYRFISREEFERRVGQGAFLEWEEIFGNLYGTPNDFIDSALAKGQDVLLSIDVKGAMNIRKVYPEGSTLVFILPPSLEELEARLRSRKTDESYVISTRLKIAREEMSYKDRYDYSVVNDNLQRAYEALKEIIRTEV